LSNGSQYGTKQPLCQTVSLMKNGLEAIGRMEDASIHARYGDVSDPAKTVGM
jgi:hypothetical protein